MKSSGILLLSLGLLACIAVSGTVFGAEEPAADVQSIALKTVTGNVGGLGMDYIAITYKQEADTEYEVLLPFDKNNIVFEGVQNIKQINMGDSVLVEYDEVTTAKEDGTVVVTRKAKKIKFLSPASTTLKSGKK